MLPTLYQLRVVPRWIIFVIDLACMYAALCCGFLLRFNFNFPEIFRFDWSGIIVAVLVVNGIVFTALRTYSGIIRHTSMQDAWRVLIAAAASSGVYSLINVGKSYNEGDTFIPYSVILIGFLCAFVLMLFYRLLVKVTFDQLNNGRSIRTHVVIYGAGYAGTVTRNVLQSQVHQEQQVPLAKVVAFIEDDPHSWGKQLEGVPIHPASVKTLNKLLRRYGFRQLVITDELLNSPHKNAIVDWCLANKVKVQHIPPIAQWIQGGLQAKQIKDIRIEDLLNRNVIRLDSKAISAQLTGKAILITGAAGSIGSELVRQIVHFKPLKVILCDQAESPLHDLALEIKELAPHVEICSFLGDIRDNRRIAQLFDAFRPQVVFHAAAYKHVPMMELTPDTAVLNNIMGTINVAERALEYGAEKFVMVSTDKAVNPTNVMGATKRIAEIYIQALNNFIHTEAGATSRTAFITTRFGNVLGSNGSVVPHFKRLIEKGGPITVTHPEVTRYFMTIPEACQLVLEAGTMGNGGEVYVFDMGEPVKITDLAVKMIQLSGLTPERDIRIVYTGLRPGEKLYEELLAHDENVLPTHHHKIMIARVAEYDFLMVKKQIRELIRLAQEGKSWKTVQHMKMLVPEYKSNNSVFEELDAANAGQPATVVA